MQKNACIFLLLVEETPGSTISFNAHNREKITLLYDTIFPMKMHEDEIEIDEGLVAQLVASQFPQWRNLSIRPVSSTGTDNAIYRLGDDMAIRLPRIDWAVGQVKKEHTWLPQLAPHLSLAVPTSLAMGTPTDEYLWHWSIYQWLEGENAATARIADLNQAALDLAHFITSLQSIPTTGGPPAAKSNSRGAPLLSRDADTREAIAALGNMIDSDAVTAIWETALQQPEWNRPPVWYHGDMLPGNILVKDGRVHAVIDFANLGVGDPACDLMIAWRLFSGESREAFRKALGVNDATWIRGKGHALSQALIFIPYYMHTNPVGVREAWHAIEQIIADS